MALPEWLVPTLRLIVSEKPGNKASCDSDPLAYEAAVEARRLLLQPPPLGRLLTLELGDMNDLKSGN